MSQKPDSENMLEFAFMTMRNVSVSNAALHEMNGKEIMN